jgi:transposase
MEGILGGVVAGTPLLPTRSPPLNATDPYEAATTMLTRTTAFCSLKAWGLRLAKKVGFKKARIGVARKLAVVLHAMWKTKTPFRWSAVAA